MDIQLVYFDPDGTVHTVVTDENHITMSHAGLNYNDGSDSVWFFQPWGRVARIVTQPTGGVGNVTLSYP